MCELTIWYWFFEFTAILAADLFAAYLFYRFWEKRERRREREQAATDQAMLQRWQRGQRFGNVRVRVEVAMQSLRDLVTGARLRDFRDMGHQVQFFGLDEITADVVDFEGAREIQTEVQRILVILREWNQRLADRNNVVSIRRAQDFITSLERELGVLQASLEEAQRLHTPPA